jgi:hypothetical protein
MPMDCFTAFVVYQSTIRIEVVTKETTFLYGTNIKTQPLQIFCCGQSRSVLTSAVVIGVQIGEMSKLG